MIDKQTLMNRLNEISKIIPKKEWEYFHLEAMENFIFHINGIENERTRDKISHAIDNCLTEILNNKEHQYELTETMKTLYANHIFKISSTYKYELGFIQKPYWPVIFTGAIVLFFAIFYFYNMLISITLITIIVISYFLYVQSKIKSKKYY